MQLLSGNKGFPFGFKGVHAAVSDGLALQELALKGKERQEQCHVTKAESPQDLCILACNLWPWHLLGEHA